MVSTKSPMIQGPLGDGGRRAPRVLEPETSDTRAAAHTAIPRWIFVTKTKAKPIYFGTKIKCGLLRTLKQNVSGAG